jgi:nucleotide-binding universal stress UspA family protein
MKILIAVDGSPCSDVAVDEAAKRPWPEGSEIKVVSVVEPLPVTPMTETWTLPPDYFDQWERAVEDRANAALDSALSKLSSRKDKAVKVTSEILKGHARDVILDEAKSWPADLILVGSHGYRGLKRLWLGSVSQAVASHAPCSVEIIRSPETHSD